MLRIFFPRSRPAFGTILTSEPGVKRLFAGRKTPQQLLGTQQLLVTPQQLHAKTNLIYGLMILCFSFSGKSDQAGKRIILL